MSVGKGLKDWLEDIEFRYFKIASAQDKKGVIIIYWGTSKTFAWPGGS